ncbi:hypothetical protein SLA2020_453390, partial [Shorea laevis]
MSCFLPGNPNCAILCTDKTISFVGTSGLPFLHLGSIPNSNYIKGTSISQRSYKKEASLFHGLKNSRSRKIMFSIPRCSSSSNSNNSTDESSNETKTPFGYTRKDVLLIGVGVTVLGVGLKSGLEFAGVDPLQAGNVVQLVLVLGLTVGWISTYIFRVSNKEMTYAQQLRDYENKVMQ